MLSIKSFGLSVFTLIATSPAFASSSTFLDAAVRIAETRLKGNVCQTEAYQPAILAQLSQYSTDSTTLIAAVTKYPVLATALKGNFAFKKLVAGYASTPLPVAMLAKLIVGTHFENHLGGDNGPGATLSFEKAGVVKVGRFVNGSMVVEAGVYKVAQVGHTLRMSVAAGPTTVVYVTDTSTVGVEELLVETLATGEPAVFSTSPWECEN